MQARFLDRLRSICRALSVHDRTTITKTNEMLDLPTIVTIITTIASAFGLKGIWNYWIKRDEQEHNQANDWTDRITERLDQAEERLDKTEAMFYKEKHKSTLLTAQVQILIERIDQLLDRLEEHETITYDERDSLTSVPRVEEYDKEI